jgi:hypothetical protein
MDRQVRGVVLGAVLCGVACSAGGTDPSGEGINETGGAGGSVITAGTGTGGSTSTGSAGQVVVPTTGGTTGSGGGGGEAAATCDGKLKGYIRDFQPEHHGSRTRQGRRPRNRHRGTDGRRGLEARLRR